jgi:hypothetical protein
MNDQDITERDGHDVTDGAHRAGCAECALVWADLEAISAEARALPRLSPSRDLWSGIEARLAPVQGRAVRRWHAHPAVRLATAASLLVTATAAITWQVATRGAGTTLPLVTEVATSSAPVPDLGEAFGVPTDVVGRVQQAALDKTVEQMDREIADLQAVLDGRRESFDPRTIAVLEQNLKVIDAAIAESREALAADPASRFLASQYARAYTSKLTLLRGAATLPAGD